MNDYITQIRAQFPALEQQVYGKPLVYLDNAATAQKPLPVLSLLAEMEGKINGNIHRAVHYLSAQCTEQYESARRAVCRFIGAAHDHEVVFTSGTTAAINLVAFSFGEAFIKSGDVVLVGEAEHHSNIVPWQLMCARKGASVRVLPVDDHGKLRMDLLPSLLDGQVRLVAVSHIGNVLGVVNPVKEIVDMAHERDIPTLIDGAQGIVHEQIDVRDLNCDFYVFSGHKLYGPTGTGILYGKESWLERMPPWQGGGDMIASVSFGGSAYAALPLKFEAGTPNFIGQAGLGAAVGYAASLNRAEVEAHMRLLTQKGMALLQEIEGLRIFGTGIEDKIPLFSFSVEGVHAVDMATLLDKMGYAVRSGQLCAEPALARFGQTNLLRASFAVYNTQEELFGFVEALKKVILMLR
ncbi:MAG: SufS family cysteine desulfurase [Bacteroidales bacterium]|nr:SufS family cysteine desulfurase [Bacteroidales bacterium]